MNKISLQIEKEKEKDFEDGMVFASIRLIIPDNECSKIIGTELIENKLIESKRTWNHWPGESLCVFLSGRLSIGDLFGFCLNDLPANISFEVDILNSKPIDTYLVRIDKDSISFRIWYSTKDWPHDWSITALFKELKSQFRSTGNTFFDAYEEDIDEAYSAIYFIKKPNPDALIKDLYDKYFMLAKQINDNAYSAISKSFQRYPFQAKFKFPDHIKYECEQYLLYFGQFLSDMGLESDTEIKRQGREILFSAIPKDKNEAIEKISKAFSLFISIPAIYEDNAISTLNGLENHIKYQRLEAQVHHLQSQLKLSEVTILAQQDHIQTLKTNSPDIFLKSLCEIIQDDEKVDGDSYLDGILKIKNYEGNGFAINTPKLLNKISFLLKSLKR